MMNQLYMSKASVTSTRHRTFSKAAASLGVTTALIFKAITKREADAQTRVLRQIEICHCQPAFPS
jgi:hypothetical protein